MAQTKLQTYMPDTVKDDSDMILHKFLNENEVKLLEEKVSDDVPNSSKRTSPEHSPFSILTS